MFYICLTLHLRNIDSSFSMTSINVLMRCVVTNVTRHWLQGKCPDLKKKTGKVGMEFRNKESFFEYNQVIILVGTWRALWLLLKFIFTLRKTWSANTHFFTFTSMFYSFAKISVLSVYFYKTIDFLRNRGKITEWKLIYPH